jgi:hypothetical protein
MKSTFLSLNWLDAAKGFVLAVLTALVTSVYQLIEAGTIQFTWVFWQPVVYSAIAGGLAYLIKNFLTNSNDKILKEEPK